jgi:predicted nucleic acid-binding protein
MLEEVAPLFHPGADVEYWVPDHCLLEVANALRKRRLRDQAFTQRQLVAAVRNLLELGLVPVPSAVLLERACELAEEVTIYDAVYVVLADARGIPLSTADRALAETAQRHGVNVLGPGTDAMARWLAPFSKPR